MTSATSIQLNDEQQQAVATALEVAHEAGHMALIGPAGTGKTTTIRAIAHRIAREFPGQGVLLLAPTHKAKRQFSAAALPRGSDTWTVARFCRTKATTWRDQDRFRRSSNNLPTITQLQGRFAFVIVDESSMVSHEIASQVVDICETAGIGVMFAGDPYQLPPVGERQIVDDGEPFDDLKEVGPESAQAPEFVDAPAIARLHTVMRHGGSILEFATGLRNNWSTIHGFPLEPAKDAESEIIISSRFGRDFVQHFWQEFTKHATDSAALYVKAPRALCYMNGTVDKITSELRRRVYTQDAMMQWQKGEIITFPEYTKTVSGAIYSSSDGIVIDSKIVEIPEMKMTVNYQTQARQTDKRIDLSFFGFFQQLTVHLVNPDGSVDRYGPRTVITPICGDESPRRIYAEASRQIQSRRLPSDHPAWLWLKDIKETYLTRINSAYAMTIHKSQGSTFSHVYVSRDLLMADDRELRNSLLYVAATRASKTLTFSATGTHAF
jgi:exodeoxyribonuclease-5